MSDSLHVDKGKSMRDFYRVECWGRETQEWSWWFSTPDVERGRMYAEAHRGTKDGQRPGPWRVVRVTEEVVWSDDDSTRNLPRQPRIDVLRTDKL